MKIFVTGTDTGVGKTFVSSLLIRELVAKGEDVMPYKPLCCGDRLDVQNLIKATGNDSLDADEVNPVWFKSPTAPFTAALIEAREVDMQSLIDRGRQLAKANDHLIVEGAGGWEVPVTSEATTADLAEALGLPVVVVVDNKLGALNHTILTIKAIQSRGLTCLGLVLNHVQEERDAASISNHMVLDEFLDVPVLAELMHDTTDLDLDPFLDAFASAAG